MARTKHTTEKRMARDYNRYSRVGPSQSEKAPWRFVTKPPIKGEQYLQEKC